MGFEPTVRCRITGFQDRLLKPLGHLSVTIKLNYFEYRFIQLLYYITAKNKSQEKNKNFCDNKLSTFLCILYTAIQNRAGNSKTKQKRKESTKKISIIYVKMIFYTLLFFHFGVKYNVVNFMRGAVWNQNIKEYY